RPASPKSSARSAWGWQWRLCAVPPETISKGAPRSDAGQAREHRVGIARERVRRLGRPAPEAHVEAGDAGVGIAADRVQVGLAGADDNLELARSAVFGAQRPQPAHKLGGLLWRVAHADPAVAETGGAAQRGRRLAADQDR